LPDITVAAHLREPPADSPSTTNNSHREGSRSGIGEFPAGRSIHRGLAARQLARLARGFAARAASCIR